MPDYSALYSPLNVPGVVGGPPQPTIVPQQTAGSGGFTPAQQAMMQQTSGGGVDFTKAGVIDPTMPVPASLQGYDPTQDSAWYKSPEKAEEAFVPEQETSIEKDTQKFAEGEERGQQRVEGWDVTVSGARAAKIEDRKSDREKRKELFKSGEITRKQKRKLRRAQRGGRKESWQAYKGDTELEAMELTDKLA